MARNIMSSSMQANSIAAPMSKAAAAVARRWKRAWGGSAGPYSTGLITAARLFHSRRCSGHAATSSARTARLRAT
jgi:hypothetical protein